MYPTSLKSPKATPRLAWVDAIKGATILLVVAGHATNFATPYDWYGSIPDDVMSAFRSFRMPLFFMLAGFFFLRKVDRSWGWWIKNRIGPFVYLFTLWALIWMGIEKFGPWDRLTTTSDIFQTYVSPNEGPWFILALATYFTMMKILRPLPIWAQFIIGAFISLPVATGLFSINPGWDNTLTYFIMFQFGAYGKDLITQLAENANVWWLIGTVFTWSGSSGVMLLQGGTFVSPMRIPVTIAGVAMGVVGVTLINKWAPWLGLTWIGTKTLPIYLLHCPIIGVLYGISPAWPAGSILVQVCVPLGAFLIATALSLALEKPLRRIPGVLSAPWRGEGAQTRPQINKKALAAASER